MTTTDPSPYIPVTAADGTLYDVPLPPRVLDLIASLVDSDRCWTVRGATSGYCRTHDQDLKPGTMCPHAEAKALIAAATEEGLMEGGDVHA